MTRSPSGWLSGRLLRGAALLLAVLALPACDDGDDGKAGPAGPAGPPGPGLETDDTLMVGEPAPGMNIEILSLDGATGEGGNFLPGDTITINFMLTKDDGSSWMLSEMDRLRALVSGPTFNYQRVIPETSGPLADSVDNGDGTFSYTFEDPIPDVYVAPYNDTDSFTADDGEMTGMALLDGTYTVGLYGFWSYDVGSDGFREVGDSTFDFLLGAADTVEPREVATLANCNSCHDQIQAHGGQRRNLVICLMCHTAGSEDRNVASAADGTPGASVDFRIMIHKIHNGAHLPSVLGVTTNPDGSRDYEADPQPYELVGFGNNVHDFGHVEFPVWPSLNYPMLRDEGYSGLSDEAQDLEDIMRGGVISCDQCHGDPDGAGPLPEPVNGDLAYKQPTRQACGSCHDDWVFELPYVANGQTMAAQFDDATCTVCHVESGTNLSVRDAHIHPLNDPQYTTGVSFLVDSLVEGGSNDGDGTLDPGETPVATFSLADRDGAPLDASVLSSMNVLIAGPTENMQLTHYASFPFGGLTGSGPWTTALPEALLFEFVGDSTGGPDMFSTSRTPLWDSLGAATTVLVVNDPEGGPPPGTTTLAAAVVPPQNYIDVDDATDFERNGYLVIDEGVVGFEEYLRIQYVDGDRIWFTSPYTSGYAVSPRFEHPAGAEVVFIAEDRVVAVDPTDYTLDEMAGTITEDVEFGGDLPVLVSYTTDFVLPQIYGVPLNGSPDLDETDGVWQGKSLVGGTYRLSIWGYDSVSISKYSESNSYRDASADPALEFLVGDATTLEPWELVSMGENCLACHGELRFHGASRAGFDNCLACHGTAGAEDRPQYVAANAPPTTEVGVNFRQMIHKIHMGEELANASTYEINGFGLFWPNNFSTHTYEHVVFPAEPTGVKACYTCHGEDNEAWLEPGSLSHPSEQVVPGRAWYTSCASCHDSDAAVAHIEVNTAPSGAESCGVCHGPGKGEAVDLMHLVR